MISTLELFCTIFFKMNIIFKINVQNKIDKKSFNDKCVKQNKIFFKIYLAVIKLLLFLHSQITKKGKDFVAQLVEHITFNDGVLGSSPSEITKKKLQFATSFFI